MSKLWTLPREILLGGSLMRWFDPRRGRARGARIADLEAGAAARDAAHRARGLVDRASHEGRAKAHAGDPVVP